MRLLNRTRRACNTERGFTFVEMLIVILVIAILAAVAVPSFLGKAIGAEDSVAQQSVAVGIRDAASVWIEGGNTSYPSSAVLADDIAKSEPQLTVIDYNQLFPGSNPSNGPGVLSVDVSDNGQTAQLCAKARPARVYCEEVNSRGQLTVVSVGSLDSVDRNANTTPSSGEVTGANELYARAALPSSSGAGVTDDIHASVGYNDKIVPIPYTPTPSPWPLYVPVSSGSPAVGQTLSVNTGVWAENPTGYTYQWEQCDQNGVNCTAISGASASSFAPTASQVGSTLVAVVTANNTYGSNSTQTAPTAVVTETPPANSTSPSVSGSSNVGQTLTANPGTWTGSPTGYTYTWQDCDQNGSNCQTIQGATSSSYTTTSGDQGHTVTVTVTASNAGGLTKSTSTPTPVITLGATNAALFAQDTTCSDNGLQVNGNNITISGNVYTDGSLSINGNNENFGSTTYGGPNNCTDSVSGNNLSFSSGPTSSKATYPWPADYSQNQPTCTFRAASYTWNANSQTLTSGTYCATGTITINGNNISGNVTLIAAKVVLNGNNFDLTPYASQLLIYQTGSSQLSLNGNNLRYGAIFAPNARVVVNGNNATGQGQIEAKEITLNGNNFNFTYNP